MGERHYGEISMPKCLIDTEIANQIEDDFDICGGIVSLFSDTQCFEQDGVITYTEEMASWGSFETLESLLKQKGVPFDRYSSSSYEYPAERVYFRPELKDEVTALLDYDGEPFVPVRDLKHLLALPEDQIKDALSKIFQTFAPEVTPLTAYVVHADPSTSGKGAC